MRIGEALGAARKRLEAASIADAGLEAEVLLRHALGRPRERLLAGLGEVLDAEAACRFEDFLQRRLGREPTAYITGHREFYGLDFEVTPATLIPRPETEVLVEAAIEIAKPRGRIRRGPVLADVGTGCGAIAVALARNVPRSDVHAVDVSAEALAVAGRNAERHGVTDRIYLHRGDLLTPLPEYVDVLVANLPYVTTADWELLPPELRDYEPREALDGGDDGLDLIRRLIAEAPAFLRPRGCLVLEFGAGQGEAVRELARAAFAAHSLEIRKDLGGFDRILVVAPR